MVNGRFTCCLDVFPAVFSRGRAPFVQRPLDVREAQFGEYDTPQRGFYITANVLS